MRLLDGLYWPDSDTQARPSLLDAVGRDMAVLLQYTTRRRRIVQAGGNVGVYPIELAKHFEEVWTFEPDPANFECLSANVSGNGRIYTAHAGLGEEMAFAGIENPQPANCGCPRLTPGEEIAVLSLDSMKITALDAIWLDVEGMELSAFKGAVETIERHRPVIMFEHKGHHRHYGVADGEIEAWLTERGYRQADRSGNDEVWLHG